MSYYRITEPITSNLNKLGFIIPGLAQRVMNAHVKRALKDSLKYTHRMIQTLTPFRTGALRRSETIERIKEIGSTMRGEIFTEIHYAQYVEPWARMFYRGSDASYDEIQRIFERNVGKGIDILTGMGQKKGRGPYQTQIRGTSVGATDEWFR